MSSTPHVIDARYLDGFRVEVWFADGRQGVVDLAEYPRKGGVFTPLSNQRYFKKIFYRLEHPVLAEWCGHRPGTAV